MRRRQIRRRVENGSAGLPADAEAATTPVVTEDAEIATTPATPEDAEALASPAPPDAPSTSSWVAQIASWRELLSQASPDELGDEDRLALLRELELFTRTAAGVGASLQVAFASSQVATQIADGVAPSRAGKAVPDDLAQARLTSPYWGSRELTSAKALVQEMPRTLSALRAGVISAAQARVITEATTCVDAADRAEIDERLAPRLAGASTKEIGALARSLVYEVDPAGFVARARKAAADRGVSVRPCPDVMGLLSARLPAPQAIACYYALRTTAEALKASGDPRTLAQLIADELFERLTGRTVVDGIDVEVGLVITDEALFAGTSNAADLIGYGPIPAQTARDLLNPTTDTESDSAEADAAEDEDTEPDATESDATEPDSDTKANASSYCPDGPRCTSFSCTLTHGHPAAGGLPKPPDLEGLGQPDEPARSGPGENSAHQAQEPARDAAHQAQEPARDAAHPTQEPAREAAHAATVWVRRLYTDPVTGILTDRDTRKRLFTGALRSFLVSRDQTCRNTWCGAPVRHIDHVQRHADRGSTDADNGRGLCARCNLARERPRQLDTPPATYRPPPPLLPCLPRPDQSRAA